jgi:hypothetical protein
MLALALALALALPGVNMPLNTLPPPATLLAL